MGRAFEQQAAGGVVWAETPSGVEIAVVHRPRYDDWSLPQGKVRLHEPTLATACRQVLTVTGVRPVVGPRLGSSTYSTSQGNTTVSYWAMHGSSGRFPSTGVVDRMEWLPQHEAHSRLTYQDQVAVLGRLERVALSADTALLLVGHASVRHPLVGRGLAWEADERRRPLDEEGLDQAARLRRGLAVFGPTELWAVDNARCMGTLDPLADDLRLTVRAEPALSEETYARAPEATMRRVGELARSRQRVAVCSHPAVIPRVVGALTGRDGVNDLSETEEGGMWALFFNQGRLLAADYYPNFAGWDR